MKKTLLSFFALFLLFKNSDGRLVGLLSLAQAPSVTGHTAVKVSDEAAPPEHLFHFLRDNWSNIKLVNGKVQVTRQKAVVQEVTEEPSEVQVKP